MDIIILKSFLPEIFLSMSILFQLVYNIKIIKNLKYNFPIVDKEVFYQTFFILICLIIIYSNLQIEGFFSNFFLLNDESTKIMKIFLLLACVFILHVILQAFSLQSLNFYEFFIIFALALLSLLLLLSSNDILSLYIMLEMQTLCFFILASFKRDSSFSAEAGLKYFIASSFISGIFLFGASLIYGCLGTLNFNALNLLLSFPLETYSYELYIMVFIGVLCIISTLLFKISCAPFHFWSPDVYEGSPLSSTVIFAVIPKIALIYFFIKWMIALNIFSNAFQGILLACGALSTLLGTFHALSQKRLKKLIIYSSIAQVGFLVSGIALNTFEAYTAVLFFLVIYTITSILIWSHFVLFYDFQSRMNVFGNRNSTSLYLSSLTNFFKVNKLWAFSFIIIFFSIGGIPPLTGFLSKILIVLEMINENQIFYSIVLIIISSISVFYYIRLIKIMFFEPKHSENKYERFQVIFHDSFLDNIYVIMSILLLILLITFFYPTMPLLICQYIVLNIFSF